MRSLYFIFGFGIYTVLPALLLAADATTGAAEVSIYPLLYKINTVIVNPLILLAFTVAFVVFFWGIVQFIKNADSPDGREQGQRNIMYGIIGMVIMVSVFGILYTVLDTFGISTEPLKEIR